MQFALPAPRRRHFPACAAALLVACTGEAAPDPGSDDPAAPFLVVGTNVPNGAVWQINRSIDVEFTADVDFATVSQTTLAVQDVQGRSVLGTFALLEPTVVRFQPRCPTRDDLSDGGLQPGRTYRIVVSGLDGSASAPTVRSTAGQLVETSRTTEFSIPDTSDPLLLFVDTRPGPPSVRVRGRGSEAIDSPLGSYVEFGGDVDDVEFLRVDAASQLGGIDRLVPLNLYSDARQRFALVLRFDQSIRAAEDNVSSRRIALEARYGTGAWFGIPSRVLLVDNCSVSGSTVRVEPLGIVPQGAEVRAVLRAGFADITGDALAVDDVGFAVLEADVASPGGVDEGAGADEILESFGLSSGDLGSLEDTSVASPFPRASWGEGSLQPGFDFPGTGGPAGTFDWVIQTGETVFLDTSIDQITGGPGGTATTTVSVIGGVVDVRDLEIREGASLVLVGPNPCTILASGRVVVDGSISADGGNSFGVVTLNTTNQPEEGGAGRVGGGDGGTGSFLTSQSTPRGGAGEGAFGMAAGGGEGGETGFAPDGGILARERRRGAGGGGGRFGPDIEYVWSEGVDVPTRYRCQTNIGMDAEPGFLGSLEGTGAISQAAPPQGGAIGPAPFFDSTDENDFFGTMIRPDGSQVLGELPSVWAGAGGGGGGDAVASATFPLTPFSPQGDEKGAGGGGGAGGLSIIALGPIEVGPNGSITADGGSGGGGENFIFFDRIGGGSGGGSGGHIVLSSASQVVVRARVDGPTVGPFYLDDPDAVEHERRPIRALGGQGGAGRQNRCGANDQFVRTQWRRDAIPQEAFEGNDTIPPQDQEAWMACNQANGGLMRPPLGSVLGGGGDGGPGLVQIHVTDPATQLLFPGLPGVYGQGLDPTTAMSPPPVGWFDPDEPAATLVPFVGARSDAFTRWIALGSARSNPDGSTNELAFLFEGTDPFTGLVRREDEVVSELDPVVPWTALATSGPALPRVDVASSTFTFAAAGFDELYVRNASLLRSAALRVRAAGSADDGTEFLVQLGASDRDVGTIELTVDPRGTELRDLLLALPAAEIELIPFSLRLVTGGVLDRIPAETSVRITFDATVADPLTLGPSADPAVSLSGGEVEGFATDVRGLDGDRWDFVRVRIEFDIDTGLNGIDVEAPRALMDFLRLSFVF
ncbi:MAG: hypothetical protein AAF957_11925 [Planctomycetota bacterium]